MRKKILHVLYYLRWKRLFTAPLDETEYRFWEYAWKLIVVLITIAGTLALIASKIIRTYNT